MALAILNLNSLPNQLTLLYLLHLSILDIKVNFAFKKHYRKLIFYRGINSYSREYYMNLYQIRPFILLFLTLNYASFVKQKPKLASIFFYIVSSRGYFSLPLFGYETVSNTISHCIQMSVLYDLTIIYK